MSTPSTPWEGFPASAMAVLEKSISAMPGEGVLRMRQTWDRLRLLVVPIERAGAAAESLTAVGAKEVLLKYLSKLTSGAKTPLHTVQQELEVARALLQCITGTDIPGIVVRQFPQPQQTLRKVVAPDFEAAARVSEHLERFLGKVQKNAKKSSLDESGNAGLFGLLLILDNGVLNRYELAAAIEAIQQPRCIRACRGSYYLWLPTISGRKSRHFGARRLFLTPRTAAVAMAFDPASGQEAPRPEDAILQFCVQTGMLRKDVPSLTSLMHGVATRLRLTPKVPQFVVDYAQARFVSHAVPEGPWRRLVGLAPWVDEKKAEATPSLPDVSEQGDPEEAGFEKEDRGYLTDARSILSSSEFSEQASVRLLALKAARSPVSEIDGLLMDWTIFLLSEKLPAGRPRRLGSVRTMLNALGPRLMAALIDVPISALGDDDWQVAQEQMLDPELSGSWRNTIHQSLMHFVSWAHGIGQIPHIPTSLHVQQADGAVHANLVTPEEFGQLIDLLEDEALPESLDDRDFQKHIARLAYAYAMRKSEARGMANREVNLDGGSTIDVVNNEHRTLKTDSSLRRIPIKLNDHFGFDDDMRSHVLDADPSERLISGHTISVSEDTLLRRLSDKLSEVTGDPDVSLHPLRHSSATWLLTTLYADDLELKRFSDDWPFLQSLIERSAQSQETLMGKRGSLHRLHAVRHVLGHRHEEMSLLHYIHALDWLRYAATTLGRPNDAGDVCAAYSATTGKALKAEPLPATMSLIESSHPDRILRDDKPRKAAAMAPGKPGIIQEKNPLRDWQLLSNGIRDGEAAVSSDGRELHSRLVDLINKKRAVSKSRSSARGISSLAEIAPREKAETALALSIRVWSVSASVHSEAIPYISRQLLETLDPKSLGRFSMLIDQAEKILPILDSLSNAAGLKFEMTVERRSRIKGTMARNAPRVSIPVKDLGEARATGSKRVVLRPRLAVSTEERETLPLQAFIWSLAMLVLYPTAVPPKQLDANKCQALSE